MSRLSVCLCLSSIPTVIPSYGCTVLWMGFLNIHSTFIVCNAYLHICIDNSKFHFEQRLVSRQHHHHHHDVCIVSLARGFVLYNQTINRMILFISIVHMRSTFGHGQRAVFARLFVRTYIHYFLCWMCAFIASLANIADASLIRMMRSTLFVDCTNITCDKRHIHDVMLVHRTCVCVLWCFWERNGARQCMAWKSVKIEPNMHRHMCMELWSCGAVDTDDRITPTPTCFCSCAYFVCGESPMCMCGCAVWTTFVAFASGRRRTGWHPRPTSSFIHTKPHMKTMVVILVDDNGIKLNT